MSNNIAYYIQRCQYFTDLQNTTRSASQKQVYQIMYNYSLESLNQLLNQASRAQQPSQAQEVKQKSATESLRETLESKGISVPDEYICPITMDIMTYPVIVSDGHVYEKSAIEKWFITHNKSPLTNCLVDKKIIPCHALRNLIQTFIINHSDKPNQQSPVKSIPETPKKKAEKQTRAPSAYNNFVKEQFPKIKENNPTLPFADIIKLIAQEWKSKKLKSRVFHNIIPYYYRNFHSY